MIQINFRLLLAFILSFFVLSAVIRAEDSTEIANPEAETTALAKHHIIIGKKFIIIKPSSWKHSHFICKKRGGKLWWPRKDKIKWVVKYLKKQHKHYLPIWVKHFGSALHEDGRIEIPDKKKLHGLCLIKKKPVKHWKPKHVHHKRKKFFLTRKTKFWFARKICRKHKGHLLVPNKFNVKRFSWLLKKKGIYGAWIHGGLVLYKNGEIKYPIRHRYRGICIVKKKFPHHKPKVAEDEADEDQEGQEDDEDDEEQEGDEDNDEQGDDENDEQGDDENDEQGDDEDDEEQGDDENQEEQGDDENQEEQGDDEEQEEQQGDDEEEPEQGGDEE